MSDQDAFCRSSNGATLARAFSPIPVFDESRTNLIRPCFHAVNSILRLRLMDLDQSFKARGRRVEFGYFSGITGDRTLLINAFAGPAEDAYVLGMDTYLPFAALDVCASFWRDPEVFPEIGDPGMGGRDGPTSFGPGLRFLTPHEFDEYSDFLPACPIRQSAAWEMSVCIAWLVWSHELAHVTRGHVDYLKAAQHRSRLWERAPPGDDPDPALTLALEVDADKDASRLMSATLVLREDKNVLGFPIASEFLVGKSREFKLTFTHAAKRLWWLIVAKATIVGDFLNADDGERTADDLRNFISGYRFRTETHPSAVARQIQSFFFSVEEATWLTPGFEGANWRYVPILAGELRDRALEPILRAQRTVDGYVARVHPDWAVALNPRSNFVDEWMRDEGKYAAVADRVSEQWGFPT